MEGLSAEISTQIGVLQGAILRLGTPQPSFEDGIPTALSRDAEAEAARQKILALTDELHALLSDPQQLLGAHTNPVISSNAICQLGLVDALPIDSPGRQVADIAKEAGVPVNLAKRLFKHAAVHHVYAETRPDFFSHTAASKLLVSDPDCQKWIRSANDYVLPGSFKIVKAFRKWNSSEEPNHSGWNIDNDSTKPVFEGLDEDPQQADHFAGAMRFFSKHPGFDMRHLLDSIDWHSLSGMTLTDVGGSAGHASMYLAERVPGLRCVVQDRAEIISQVRDSVPARLADRVSFEAHDMFEPQPRKGDVFLFRLIFHDWSATYARKILRALIPGMRVGSRLLVQDTLLPSHGAPVSDYHQKIGRALDLNMLGLQNGQERDLDDWRSIMAQTSERFQLTGVHQREGSVLSVLEFTWTIDELLTDVNEAIEMRVPSPGYRSLLH